MGIYSNGIIYGIKVIQKNLDENCDLNDEYITILDSKTNKLCKILIHGTKFC